MNRLIYPYLHIKGREFPPILHLKDPNRILICGAIDEYKFFCDPVAGKYRNIKTVADVFWGEESEFGSYFPFTSTGLYVNKHIIYDENGSAIFAIKGNKLLCIYKRYNRVWDRVREELQNRDEINNYIISNHSKYDLEKQLIPPIFPPQANTIRELKTKYEELGKKFLELNISEYVKSGIILIEETF